MCIRAHMYALHEYGHMCVCGGQKLILVVLCIAPTLFFDPWSLTETEVHLLWLVWIASSQRFHVPALSAF